jgi:hypothetical protein
MYSENALIAMLQENAADIGAVNTGVARGARLGLNPLVVVRNRRRRGGTARRRKVALKTNSVHGGAIEQVRIWPSVRDVAGRAAFAPYGSMLIDERAGRLAVAPYAKVVLLEC